MMKNLAAILVVCALVAGAAFTLHQYEQVKPEDPLGKNLLYLPNESFFRIAFFGNAPLAADVLYLWSIQHYSRFQPNTQFQYLDRVFDLITDLDPKYIDPYRVGALIMLIEAEGDPTIRKQSVLKLLDKGIRNNPKDYKLAMEAAWHNYMKFDDIEQALFYANIARQRKPDSNWINRLYGHFSREAGSLSNEELIQFWQELYEQASTDYQRQATANQLHDLIAERDKEYYNPYLEAFSAAWGRCPKDWQELIQSGISPAGKPPLNEIPIDFRGNEYLIDQENCSLVVYKKISEQ